MQSIEEEIDQFSVNYFKSYTNFLDEELDFIEDNRLFLPKENYTIAIELLAKILKHFQVLDVKFYHKTLKKLLDDIHKSLSYVWASIFRITYITSYFLKYARISFIANFDGSFVTLFN